MKLIKLVLFFLFFTVSCQTNSDQLSLDNATVEEDREILANLFKEITTTANSISCSNSSNWTFVAYGTKACGGPQGYIAYSKTIDTVLFLKKVATYTRLENDFNIKWSVFSTCDIPIEPTSVVCENGKPTFRY